MCSLLPQTTEISLTTRVTWLLLLYLSSFDLVSPLSSYKGKFGRGEERLFRAEWYQENNWLHYDVDKGAPLSATLYLCMKCKHEKKFLSSKKREPAFIFKGYTYWKEDTTAFKKHQTSDCHCEAVEVLLVLPQCTKDIAELQSTEHAAQKTLNHHMFMIILNNLRFLVCQATYIDL